MLPVSPHRSASSAWRALHPEQQMRACQAISGAELEHACPMLKQLGHSPRQWLETAFRGSA